MYKYKKRKYGSKHEKNAKYSEIRKLKVIFLLDKAKQSKQFLGKLKIRISKFISEILNWASKTRSAGSEPPSPLDLLVLIVK